MPPVSPVQENAQQLLCMERRDAEEDYSTRIAATGLALMFLFGACSALWAQKTGRNVFLWFFTGLALNLAAPLLILWLTKRKRKKRMHRYRQVKDYWTLPQQ